MVRSTPLLASEKRPPSHPLPLLLVIAGMAKARMLLFCNDVVWDPESHLAAAEMLKESTPGSELWCATNLCTSPLCASRLCKALAAGAAAGR